MRVTGLKAKVVADDDHVAIARLLAGKADDVLVTYGDKRYAAAQRARRNLVGTDSKGIAGVWKFVDETNRELVAIARNLRDRKLQRALMQFFKPENWFLVRRALLDEGRGDLIGSGRECLIPGDPPPEALEARRRAAERAARSGRARGPEGEDDGAHDDADAGSATDATYTHAEDAGTSPTVAPTPRTFGYRPHRSGAGRRDVGSDPAGGTPDRRPARGPDRRPGGGPSRGPRRPQPPAR